MTNDITTRVADIVEDPEVLRTIQALGQVTSGLEDPEDWLIDAIGGGRATSGARVTPYTVLGIPAVKRSVDLIAGHISGLQLQVRRRTPNGSEEVVGHEIANLINIDPSDNQTGTVFKEAMMIHALIEGNARALVVRNGFGAPVELLIIFPSSCFSSMVDGEKWHTVYFDPRYYPLPGSNQHVSFPDRNVLHIPAISRNGLWGERLVDIAKDPLGLAQAGMDSLGYHFNNAGRPGMILQVPNNMARTDKEGEEILANARKVLSGAKNRGILALLRHGMDLTTLPPESGDSGLADLVQMTDEQVALLFGTEKMLGKANAVYKDLPDRMADYLQNTLNPWLEKWEHECDRKLLNPLERQSGMYCEFDSKRLLRGNPNSLADYTGKLRAQGAISGNEVRMLHGMNPVSGLDTYENPNVGSPRTSEAEPPARDDDEEDRDESEANNATRRWILNLIETEKRQVTHHARKEGNFLAWCDRYYRRFEEKMTGPAGADQARRYCDRSRAMLLDLTGVVSQDKLAENVSRLVSNWHKRENEFDV